MGQTVGDILVPRPLTWAGWTPEEANLRDQEQAEQERGGGHRRPGA